MYFEIPAGLIYALFKKKCVIIFKVMDRKIYKLQDMNEKTVLDGYMISSVCLSQRKIITKAKGAVNYSRHIHRLLHFYILWEDDSND